jgi:hypothetical protein
LDNDSITSLAPDVVEAVPKWARKTQVLAETLQNSQWIRDVSGSLSLSALRQYISLWTHLLEFQLDSTRPDMFIWKLSSHQQYSISLTYRAFFHGQCGIPCTNTLCKTEIPPRYVSCPFGSFYWIVAGSLKGGSDISFRPMTSVPCARRWCNTCSSTVLIAVKRGSHCCVGQASINSLHCRMILSLIGG